MAIDVYQHECYTDSEPCEWSYVFLEWKAKRRGLRRLQYHTYVVTVTNDSNGLPSTASTVVTQDNTPPTATADNIGGPLTCVDNAVTIRISLM